MGWLDEPLSPGLVSREIRRNLVRNEGSRAEREKAIKRYRSKRGQS